MHHHRAFIRVLSAAIVLLGLPAGSGALAAPPLRPAAAYTQVALTASDGAAGDNFGYAVAIEGDTAVVGAPYAQNGSGTSQGAAYVFVNGPQGWQPKAKLTYAGSQADDNFGISVALSGDTIAVGADLALGPQDNWTGAVYVYTRPAGGWATTNQPAVKLIPPDGEYYDLFGTSVAVSGPVIAVGAPNHEDPAQPGTLSEGTVYVFTRPAPGWGKATTPAPALLTAAVAQSSAYLGQSLALLGDTLVAGAPGAAGLNLNASAGAAFVYTKPACANWATTNAATKLIAVSGADGDQFGQAVSLRSDGVAVSAPQESPAGAAYFFAWPSEGWQPWHGRGETARLSPSDTAHPGCFGSSVASEGWGVFLGASCRDVPAQDPNGNPISLTSAGSVYSYTRPPDGWVTATESDLYHALPPLPGEDLGSALGVSGSTLLVGAPSASPGNKANAGTAYIFNYTPLGPDLPYHAFLPVTERAPSTSCP